MSDVVLEVKMGSHLRNPDEYCPVTSEICYLQRGVDPLPSKCTEIMQA